MTVYVFIYVPIIYLTYTFVGIGMHNGVRNHCVYKGEGITINS